MVKHFKWLDDDDKRAIHSEMPRYVNFLQAAFDTDSEVLLPGDKDVVGWYVSHRVDFPVLSKLAFQVAVGQTSSAAVERAFSVFKRLVDDNQSNMSMPSIESGILGHCNKW